MRTKLITGIVSSLLISTSCFSQTMSCKVTFVEASREDPEISLPKNVKKILKINLNDNGSTAEQDQDGLFYTSSLGQKIEIYPTIKVDPNVTGLKEIDLTVIIDGKIDRMSKNLMKYVGISSGGTWHYGPLGSIEYKVIGESSLSVSGFDINIFQDAFKVLTDSRTFPNGSLSDEWGILKLAQLSVQRGDLKQGSALFVSIANTCWIQTE
jgi:hypothetical protein